MTAPTQLLTVISLNLRYDKPDPGDRAWAKRQAAVLDLIQDYQPDLLGTQEGKAHQLLDLHRALPNYQSIGGDRQGTGYDERCAIFYRRDRLTCTDHGDFWLSATPAVVGSMTASWGNSMPRMATWGIFHSPERSRPLLLINTHLDYASATARELGAKTIGDHLHQFGQEAYDCLLTGDFNCAPDEPPRQYFSQALSLRDALAQRPLAEQMSYHEYGDRAFRAIDTVYYGDRLDLRHAEIDRARRCEVWVSDHCAAIAQFD
ncbi:MAG: endonuclease/exonuclease/phosphatase family protein [Spirulinaceae cyanobacterium RM2_2_10]|nr:endonuclease/exonuclease/phosphatase family protein [Spirulinaceae cyanobacterium SM2_1_0]NJO18866.1 endonuclease/exonuclease/phosphatase family protein [Spirulinaceae cyanobacterium RM2_2_10]